jgi:hypothetical protein
VYLCWLVKNEHRQMLFPCLELKQIVSSLLVTNEHVQPLFASLELKRSVSSFLQGSGSCFVEGSEHRHPLFCCLEFK